MNSSTEDDGDKREAAFQSLISRMKACVKQEDIHRAITHAKEALKIRHSDKLVGKLKKMEEFMREKEEEAGDMEHLGNGLYLELSAAKKIYGYQKEGLCWLWNLFKKRKGGILGDDMGLGKTIQIVTFMSAMFDLQKVKSVLIIMPLSLIPNWEKEFEDWAPNINLYVYHDGTKLQRARVLEKVQRRGGIMLSTYGLLTSSSEQLGMDQFRYGQTFIWDYIILDEGHKIKNPTKSTKGAHAIPARNRIVLTGTPIQNNLQELWSLFDFVHQGTLLGTAKTFKMEFGTPISRSREKDASAAEKRLGYEMAEILRNRIAPYFMRRTKAEVMGKGDTDGSLMPDLLGRKNDFVVWTFLSPVQIQMYELFLHSDTLKQVLMTTRSPLVELNIMKKICDHPRLLSVRACKALGLYSSQILDDLTDDADYAKVSDEHLIAESGKMLFLIKLLKNLKSDGHRCLVFSQSRKILDMIERILRSLGIHLMRIDGTVSAAQERQRRVDIFNSSPKYSVFLLTSQVGGIGLTITSANRVVIFDPSWNPATDSQAVDRAYRIGQKRSVIVYRLITCGTIEEKIYRRQIFKQSLHKQATDGAKNPFRYFTMQEIRGMFKLDDPKYSTTQVQLEKMHAAHRNTDTELDLHVAQLYSFDIFGISDHDQMFSITEVDDEVDQQGRNYVDLRVNRAEKLVEMECAMSEHVLEAEKKFVRPNIDGVVRKSNAPPLDKRPPLESQNPNVINIVPRETFAKHLRPKRQPDLNCGFDIHDQSLPSPPTPPRINLSAETDGSNRIDIVDVSTGIHNMNLADDDVAEEEEGNNDVPSVESTSNVSNDKCVVLETPEITPTSSPSSTVANNRLSHPIVISDSEVEEQELGGSIIESETSAEDSLKGHSVLKGDGDVFNPLLDPNFLDDDAGKASARKLRRTSMFINLVNNVEHDSDDDGKQENSTDDSDASVVEPSQYESFIGGSSTESEESPVKRGVHPRRRLHVVESGSE